MFYTPKPSFICYWKSMDSGFTLNFMDKKLENDFLSFTSDS